MLTSYKSRLSYDQQSRFSIIYQVIFLFNSTATTENYTYRTPLSRPDALPFSRFTARRQTVEIRPADRTAVGAERDRLQHVGAAAYASVGNQLRIILDPVADRREIVDRRCRSIALATAMIGHHDRIEHAGERASTIVGHNPALAPPLSGPLHPQQL